MPHLRLNASLTHASLTSLNSSSCLTVFESVNLTIFFFSLLTRTTSRSRSHPLCSTLCFSATLGIDFFSFDFDFDYLILFLSFDQFLVLFLFFFFFFFFFFHFFRLHLRFSIHVLGFILGSPFCDFTTKW